MVRAIELRIILRPCLNITVGLMLASKVLVSMCGELIGNRYIVDMLRAIQWLSGSVKGVLFGSCAFTGVAGQAKDLAGLHQVGIVG